MFTCEHVTIFGYNCMMDSWVMTVLFNWPHVCICWEHAKEKLVYHRPAGPDWGNNSCLDSAMDNLCTFTSDREDCDHIVESIFLHFLQGFSPLMRSLSTLLFFSYLSFCFSCTIYFFSPHWPPGDCASESTAGSSSQFVYAFVFLGSESLNELYSSCYCG